MTNSTIQKKILVVEDEMSYRMVLAKIIRDRGFSVDVAANGTQAMERMQKEHYNAVLVDNLMPSLSGLELVKWMKTNLPPIPTFVITGYPSEEMKEKFLQLNVAAYISKGDCELSSIAEMIYTAVK